MTLVLVLLLLQGLMGALDNLWHHELAVALPSRPGARRELFLHAAREAIYGLLYLGLAWAQWRGLWATGLVALLIVEIWITLTDFLEEDRTRRLPPSERVLHTLLAIGFGVALSALAPVMAAWAALPTGVVLAGHGGLSWIASLFGVVVLAWAARDGIAARRSPRFAPVTTACPSGRTVLVTGATGFIGRALTARLLARGDRVIVLTREAIGARARFGAAPLVVESLDLLPAETRIDAVVNLAGAPIVAGRWTPRRRHALLQSRLAPTRAVTALIARLETKPQVLISASGAGFYGDRDDRALDERSGPSTGFMSELCRRWEEAAVEAQTHGVRVCRLRLGLVFAGGGGILPQLALPARLGLGAVLGTGDQWTPWIALEDALGLIEQAIEDPRYAGPINAVAPQALTQGELTRALAATFGRPQVLRIPAWPLRRGLGELSDLFLASQRVRPARLAELGFRFEKPGLDQVLAELAPQRHKVERGAAAWRRPRAPDQTPVTGSTPRV